MYADSDVEVGNTIVSAANRHALAALCLHGQEFGFTREDVEAIRECARVYASMHGERGDGLMRRHPTADLATSAASRIEALLPPSDAK